MKVLIQRVKKASVTIEGQLYSSINKGVLAFVGIEKGEWYRRSSGGRSFATSCMWMY